jgi:hypothetical protein
VRGSWHRQSGVSLTRPSTPLTALVDRPGNETRCSRTSIHWPLPSHPRHASRASTSSPWYETHPATRPTFPFLELCYTSSSSPSYQPRPPEDHLQHLCARYRPHHRSRRTKGHQRQRLRLGRSEREKGLLVRGLRGGLYTGEVPLIKGWQVRHLRRVLFQRQVPQYDAFGGFRPDGR